MKAVTYYHDQMLDSAVVGSYGAITHHEQKLQLNRGETSVQVTRYHSKLEAYTDSPKHLLSAQ